MAPSITVFTHSRQNIASIINILEKYWAVSIDGREYDHRFVADKYKNSKLFILTPLVSSVNHDQLEYMTPDIAATLDEGTEVSSDLWIQFESFLQIILNDHEDDDLFEEISKVIEAPVKQEVMEDSIKSTVGGGPCSASDHYEYSEQHLPDVDLMFCQVMKPNSDLPYSICIKNYSAVGRIPFFTALYDCPSWGLTGNDTLFLENVWKDYMSGKFDMDQLMEDAIALRKQDESNIVKVYRKTTDEIMPFLLARSLLK